MADPIDLSGAIAIALDTARDRDRPAALAYLRADGTPSVSFRGGLHVLGRDVLAVWVRDRDSGLATGVDACPNVTLAYWTPDGSGVTYLALEGRARRAPELDDRVWRAITQTERDKDPERRGVAIAIDVDAVHGYAVDTGPFAQARP